MTEDALAGTYGRKLAEPGGVKPIYIEALGVVGSSHYAIRLLNDDRHLASDATTLITIEDLATYAFYDTFAEANAERSTGTTDSPMKKGWRSEQRPRSVLDAEFVELPLEWSARGARLPDVQQTDGDDHLVEMWVARSASPGTRRKYLAEARRLRAFVGKPLPLVRLGDLQAYLASLEAKAATRANATASIKSLFSFAQEIGYVRFNIGKAVKAPQ